MRSVEGTASRHGRMRLIANPRAGRGAVASTLPTLLSEIAGHGLEHELVETTGPGHATRAAREALDAGVRFLVAVGGDGTLHEVVNGLVEWVPAADGSPPQPRVIADDVVLGVAAAGSGCDFARTFGLERKPAVVARRFTTGNVMPIDLGVVRYRDLDGRPAQRVFANIAEVGYGAEVVRLAARMPRWIGRLRYLLAAWGAIAALQRQETSVAIGSHEHTVPVVNVVVANGQFFGGGMKVAPRALPDDNRFNVQVFTGERSQVFIGTPKIFRGEHIPHPNIIERMAQTVSLAPAEALAVEADGEILGTTPASFSLMPKALTLKI